MKIIADGVSDTRVRLPVILTLSYSSLYDVNSVNGMKLTVLPEALTLVNDTLVVKPQTEFNVVVSVSAEPNFQGLFLADVHLPAGLEVDQNSLTQLQAKNDVDFVETQKGRI